MCLFQITCADIRYAHSEQADHSTAENGGVIAAIAITGVAAGCFLLLIILMVSGYATWLTQLSNRLPIYLKWVMISN